MSSTHEGHAGSAPQLPDPRIGLLSRVGVFQLLSPLSLQDLATLLVHRPTAPGEVVLVEGAAPDGLYVIDQGTFAVEAGGATIARLGPGEFFGETAMLTGRGRTATVRSEQGGSLWLLTNDAYAQAVRSVPGLEQLLAKTSERREADRLAQQEYSLDRVNLAQQASGKDRLLIGRLPDNDLVIDSRLVSGRHAEITRRVYQGGTEYVLRDVGSTFGTFVNGAEIREVVLKDGDQIQMADTRLAFDTAGLSRVHQPKGIRIDCIGLRKDVKGGVNLLQDINLSFLPGEFVAIVGGSGAGKSTLMDALSGVRPGTGGKVLYNGEDFYPQRKAYTSVLGYVPQDDIIHRELPTRVTLDFAARLRLPRDTPKAERARIVQSAIEQLGLDRQADLKVKALSGGQRKRASIGVELLTSPRVFFLDEPTSGLDPATDRSMMELMRDLADRGSTVVLTTHATKNTILCDKVVFMARGGHLAFFGTPQRALQYFGVEAFDEIYSLLETETPEAWGARFRNSEDYHLVLQSQITAPAAAGSTGPTRLSKGQRGLGLRLSQWATLTKRSFGIYRRDPARTAPLFVQPFAFALLLIALFRTGTFDPQNPNQVAPIQFLFIVLFTLLLFGLLYGTQEIVSEFSIFKRERLVNLGVVPYVASKLALLVPILAFAVTIVLGVLLVTDRIPSGETVGTYAQLWFTGFLTAVVGLALALFSSSIARTSQAATDLLSVWIMPQVLFCGATFPVPSMTLIGRLISAGMPLRWGFEGSAKILLVDKAGPGTALQQTLTDFFGTSLDRGLWQNWVILAGFIVLPLALAVVVLRGRTKV